MTAEKIRLGMIGMSPGNGHPYSWSAILNGYDPVAMADCEFPVIPQYLAQQNWPEDRLPGAEVTHIWTQDRNLSEKVARAALIPNIVDSPREMIGRIDGLLLARDDPENHMEFARAFLDAGLPVYIDKPIGTSLAALDALYGLQRYPGQIFSCSAFGYSNDLKLSNEDLRSLGEVRFIQATTPKSWKKYAVHIIEPVLRMPFMKNSITTVSVTQLRNNGASAIVKVDAGPLAAFTAIGDDAVCPVSIRVCGDAGSRELVLQNTFQAFKGALRDFLDGIRTGTERTSPAHLRRVVSIIESAANA